MNERDETNSLTRDSIDERSTPRLDKGTLVGCAGLLLVLSLPALLFLPLERLQMPTWVANLVLLLMIGAAVLGGYLLVQVPSHSPIRSQDPNFPLTTTGRSPLLEHPAERSNRFMLLLCGGLLVCAAVGYGIVSFTDRSSLIAAGTLLISASGYALLISGMLAARRLVPVPAWRWVRVPVQRGVVLQALPMLMLGLITLIWALFLGVEDRYLLLPLGLGLLVVAAAYAGGFLQRAAHRRER
jgi:hypothetical protein